MKHVLVLGGGVGGTLAANLIARKLKRAIARGEAKVTVVDGTGEHAYQPGYMYIAMGNERPERLHRPERSLLDGNVELLVETIERIDPTTETVTERLSLGQPDISAIACSTAPRSLGFLMRASTVSRISPPTLSK